ncbi:unnamed protein product [Clonostachys chloroleuca]|uniref:Uncharacterized protein n=1 Tax=Clonostachys chloroleuca TaxID=1926264 RepID=A0AA35LZY4_9HYPO|nr:unnamed protein product [Clonostachys chloroleuca]
MVALKHLGATALLCLGLVNSGLAQLDTTSDELAPRDNTYEQILARGVDVSAEKRGEDEELDARDIEEELYVRKVDPNAPPPRKKPPPRPHTPPPPPPPTRPPPPPPTGRGRGRRGLDDYLERRALYLRKIDPNAPPPRKRPITPPRPPPSPPPPPPPTRRGRGRRSLDDYLDYLEARDYYEYDF